jgi:hypothetical protein
MCRISLLFVWGTRSRFSSIFSSCLEWFRTFRNDRTRCRVSPKARAASCCLHSCTARFMLFQLYLERGQIGTRKMGREKGHASDAENSLVRPKHSVNLTRMMVQWKLPSSEDARHVLYYLGTLYLASNFQGQETQVNWTQEQDKLHYS